MHGFCDSFWLLCIFQSISLNFAHVIYLLRSLWRWRLYFRVPYLWGLPISVSVPYPHHVFLVYPFPFSTPVLKSTRLCSVPVVRSQNISVPFPYPHRVQPTRTRSVSFPSFGGGRGTGTDIVPRTSSYGIGLLGRAPRQAPMFLIKKHWPFFRGPFCLTLFSAFF